METRILLLLLAGLLGGATVTMAPASTADAPAPKVPTYSISGYRVTGVQGLEDETIQRAMSPATGTHVTLPEIRRALARLRQAYRDHGVERVALTLRRQALRDGVVEIEAIDIPLPTLATKQETELQAPDIAAPAPPAPSFEVRRYEVIGNTLLRPETIEQAFVQATGKTVTLAQIQEALGNLQLAYRERGYATVSVGLPQQQLTDAVIKVQVTEGVLSAIRVTGNRYFSSNNVVRALPSLRTNTMLNSQVFQRELDVANQNRDRQIYPTLGPGPEPGTSALTLRVKDRLPLHARVELNNLSTPGTPDWRINTSGQFNNLWQREHQLGVSYGFSPEEFKAEGLVDDYILNRPLISYIGGYYRLPLGSAESVEERIRASGAFGFDEASRQFRLPPAGGRPELAIVASTSSSDTGVQAGRATIVSQTPLLTIVSQDTGRNLSLNDSAGVQVSLPRAIGNSGRLSLSGGIDWKRYYLESFNTNNFIITTVVTNSQGSQTIESRVSSPQPVRQNEVNYLPVYLGADYFRTDSSGSLSANLTLGGNVVGGSDHFAALAYSRKASAAYGKATLSVARDQVVFNDWSLLMRASGQAATGPLISTEQFALGGMNSVRGYYAGDEYGDAGWSGGVELRTPFITTRVPTWNSFAPVWLRGWVFVDTGQRFLLEAPPNVAASRFLLGAGLGMSANINNTVDMRITVGWPLTDSANTAANDPRAYFSLGGQF